jgi:hypothetical protein
MEPNEDLKHAVRKQTESDLLKKLKSIAVETNEAMEASEVVDVNKKDISSLFSSLKVNKFLIDFKRFPFAVNVLDT